MTTWAVTGGAGYIGAHVARRLIDAGRDVVVIDDLSTGHRAFVPGAPRFVESSIQDLRAGDLDGVDGVVHLAALKYAGVSVDEPLRFYRNNVDGTVALLDAMVAAGVDRLVYSSSSSVYGTPAAERVVEDTPPSPESPYGETKLIGEWLAAATGVAHGLRHTSLRYFNVVGSGAEDLYDSSPHNLFPLVFRAVDAGEAPRFSAPITRHRTGRVCATTSTSPTSPRRTSSRRPASTRAGLWRPPTTSPPVPAPRCWRCSMPSAGPSAST